MERILQLILAVLRGQSSYREIVQITPSSEVLDPPVDALWLAAADTVTFKDAEGNQTSLDLPAKQFFPVRTSVVSAVTGGSSIYGARL